VLVRDIAVPLVDVAKMLTEYVPGARPKSTSYAVALAPAFMVIVAVV